MKPQGKARNRPVQAHREHNGRERNGSASDDVHTRVARLAYSFYEQRGREDGHDVNDWIQAEKTILEDMASKKNRTRTRSKS